jgi:hypothetical protein
MNACGNAASIWSTAKARRYQCAVTARVNNGVLQVR